MYVDADAIIKLASLLSAIALIGGILFTAFRWYLRQKQIEKEVKEVKEELCLISYGLLACLKGHREMGCNGPVSEAILKMEKFINKKAHDQE